MLERVAAASVVKRRMAHNGRYPKARVIIPALTPRYLASHLLCPPPPPPRLYAPGLMLGNSSDGVVPCHWQVARELEKTESALAALEGRVDALREKNALLDERNKLLVGARCC